MTKKKRLKIALIACFILVSGILYTISYLRPWKKEVVLLNGTNETADGQEDTIYCADSNLSQSAESNTQDDSDSSVNIDDTLKEEQNKYFYIHICGAVKVAGVYSVPEGSRLNDVVNFAGGLTKEAASEFVNLAQIVSDGQQYYIPTQEEVSNLNRIDDSHSYFMKELNKDISAGSDALENGRTADVNQQGVVNINTASCEELMELPGVGEQKANAIIEYRNTVGLFETIEDVMKINGIKEGLFEKMKNKITVK